MRGGRGTRVRTRIRSRNEGLKATLSWRAGPGPQGSDARHWPSCFLSEPADSVFGQESPLSFRKPTDMLYFRTCISIFWPLSVSSKWRTIGKSGKTARRLNTRRCFCEYETDRIRWRSNRNWTVPILKTSWRNRLCNTADVWSQATPLSFFRKPYNCLKSSSHTSVVALYIDKLDCWTQWRLLFFSDIEGDKDAS